MRNSTLVILFVLLSATGFSQLTKAQEEEQNKKLLSTGAFSHMMTNLYSYTINGTNTPTTGFKVETAKPTITLTGNIPLDQERQYSMSLSLTGGLKDNFGQLFSNKKLNGYFKASVGFNRLIGWYSAVYKPVAAAEKLYLQSLIDENEKKLKSKADTAVIVQELLDDKNYSRNFQTVFGKIKTKALKHGSALNDAALTALIKQVMQNFSQHDLSGGDDEGKWTSFKKNMQDNLSTEIKLKELFETKSRMEGFPKAKDTAAYSYAAEQFKNFWVRRKICWLNLTPYISNSSTTMYDETLIKLTDTASLTFGLQLSFNQFFKWKAPGRFAYYKIGVELARTDNLTDLSKFDYQKNTYYDTAHLVTLSETASGTAFKGSLKSGFLFGFGAEGYASPWKKSFAPGLYGNLQYKYSDVWINKNKVSLELGLLWNVTSSDKESKNLLSIIPYVSWSNLKVEYKTDVKTQENKRTSAELFSVGLKLSLPINIGKD